MDQEKIGQIIKELRKKNHLTQAELASQLGVTYQAVSKWENGKNIPDIAIMKRIADLFDLDMNTILGDQKKKKENHKKYWIVLISSIIILLIIILLLFFLNKKETFEFKTLSSACNNFTISGSIAYNSQRSSIYISDINYCGEKDNTLYKNIECTLYEKTNNNKRLIDEVTYRDTPSITLDEFLTTTQFHIDDYEKTCQNYEDNTLFLEIKATDENDKVTYYQIPLSLQDNCHNE